MGRKAGEVGKVTVLAARRAEIGSTVAREGTSAQEALGMATEATAGSSKASS